MKRSEIIIENWDFNPSIISQNVVEIRPIILFSKTEISKFFAYITFWIDMFKESFVKNDDRLSNNGIPFFEGNKVICGSKSMALHLIRNQLASLDVQNAELIFHSDGKGGFSDYRYKKEVILKIV